MKTGEYISNLELSGICESFSDYNNGYIGDVVSEIADYAVSVYTNDQIRFAVDNLEWADEAVASGLTLDPGDCRSFRDYCAAVGATASYLANESELYEHLDDCLKLSVCSELETRGYHELNEDHVFIIDGVCGNDFDRIEEAIDWVVFEFDKLNEADAA